VSSHIFNEDRSPEGAEMRRAAWLKEIAAGKSWEEACDIVGIGHTTPKKWLYRNKFSWMNKDFQARYADAKRQGAVRATGVFPDFLTFRELCCAYMDRRQGKHEATGQWTVVRARNSFYQRDSNAKLESSKRLEVVLPPAHIKTTMWSIERSVWDIMNDREFRITAIQKNQGEAKKLIAAVQERLDHDYYHNLRDLLVEQGDDPIICPICEWFPDEPFKPDTRKHGSGEKWGAEAFKVLGSKGGEKDFTMQAVGAGGQVQGIRADRIILDDVQDPTIAFVSPADGQRLMTWFQAVVFGRVYDYQQVVVLANFFAPDDFAHLIIRELGDEFEFVAYPAILNEDEREVLCPETWTFEALMKKKKEVGPQVWHYTWMQDEESFEGMTFQRDALEAARDENFKLGEVPLNVSDVFIGCDPAQAASGYCAIVAWGLDRKSKQRYLIDVFNKTGMRTWNNVTDQIVEFCNAYKPVRQVIVEGNNTQKSMTNEPYFTRQVTSTGARYKIYQTVTGTGGRAIQSNYDITTIGRLFDEGMVVLPYGGTVEERRRVDEYIDQLARWRTDEEGRSIKHLTRDMVMATLFAESEAFEMANKPTEPVIQRSRAPGWAKPWQKKTVKRSWQEIDWTGKERVSP